MPLINTRALVLRETKYKEADKMLTVLSETYGKLSLRAGGALKKGSKYAAATEALAYSDMTLFVNNGRWSLNEAQTIDQFLPLRADISRLALGIYFAELMEAVSDEDSVSPELLPLGLNALFALSGGLFEQEHIKAVFELRLMALSGYEPALSGCNSCGKVDITHPALSLCGGALYCADCYPGGEGPRAALDISSLAAMRHIAGAAPKRVFSFELKDGGAAQRLYSACEDYSRTQLERSFGALDYWKLVRKSINS